MGTFCSISGLAAVTHAAETNTNNNGVLQTVSQDYQDVKNSSTTRAEDLKGDAKQAWQKTKAASNTDEKIKDKYTQAKDTTKHSYDKNKQAVEKTTKQGKMHTGDTWDKTKASTSNKWDKTKNYTADKWDKTKNYTSDKWDKTKEYTKKASGKAENMKKDITDPMDSSK